MPKVRFGLALNPNTPHDLIRALAADRSAQVRAVVPQTPNHPEDVYELLSHDRSVVVREFLAESGWAPRHILKRMLRDPDPAVVKHARGRLRAGPLR